MFYFKKQPLSVSRYYPDKYHYKFTTDKYHYLSGKSVPFGETAKLVRPSFFYLSELTDPARRAGITLRRPVGRQRGDARVVKQLEEQEQDRFYNSECARSATKGGAVRAGDSCARAGAGDVAVVMDDVRRPSQRSRCRGPCGRITKGRRRRRPGFSGAWPVQHPG